MLSRRSFLGAAAGACIAACGAPGSPVRVRLAAGERAGLYYAFATLLSDAAAQGSRLRIDPITTAGSVDNLDLLASGKADLALSLMDSITPGARVRAIGRVYENYFQLAVRTDSSIRSLADLRGARINLGAQGSGAASTGARMLATAGLDRDGDLEVSHLRLVPAVESVLTGTADALLWAGGVPTPALQDPGLRLIDLSSALKPLRSRYGAVYDSVRIPGAEVETIGVANLLLSAPSLSRSTASSVVRLLVDHAADLVPAETLGTQFLDIRSMIGTGSIPLHPGAADAYQDLHG
jgi:TRAP transporter TAXI family solute receptor